MPTTIWNRLQTWICKQGRIHTCTSVCDSICMPACLHIYWYGQRQTESDHCWSLIRPPISSLAHRDNDGQTAVPMCPCPSPTPLSPPLTSSARIDPLSVRCSQDQQPRQYPFHHSGPQCPFHKLSQALGLKGCIAMGFGLCKHTNACGWQVGPQIAMPCLPPIFSSLHPSLKPVLLVHPLTHTVSTSISGGAKEQEAFRKSGNHHSQHHLTPCIQTEVIWM